ncbi:hypothetical protein O2W18_04445 [Modestobacter sp. VKM Ac-2983]|uniref:hypothetical protein n=1 Tax=Modestobacter sp. VKM Ac-2983 TaxID=3004137 RepID=UPI0022AB9ECB|nr:hypothetical protein [Modestobacter sp. VKM Ac-2983]MCZ2804343.1 hypothetical protein [Modestobacter sp. VKM Ac-2983]
MSPEEKVKENRLRRIAARRGLQLTRSRRRDPRALDYGRYWLTDVRTNALTSPEDGLTLDQVEEHLA